MSRIFHWSFLPGLLALALPVFSALPAEAHVGISSGPGFADKNQVVTFAVGHGCEGADTLAIRIELPASVTSVRALPGDLGNPVVETSSTGVVRAVRWQKPIADVAEGDTNFYELSLRMRVPNAPFTTLHFPTRQTCRRTDGTTLEVDWIGTDPHEGHGGEGPEPAPSMLILPPRLPGWNKFVLPAPITDLARVFGDAQIVWRGSAAYSSNPVTVEQIAQTSGVTALTALAAGDEVWVKY